MWEPLQGVFEAALRLLSGRGIVTAQGEQCTRYLNGDFGFARWDFYQPQENWQRWTWSLSMGALQQWYC
jgi:hypothetical protein